MDRRAYPFTLGLFLFLIRTSTLFAEKKPVDLFLTPNARENPFFATASGAAGNPSLVEKAKIHYLIEALRKSPLTFIRNGEALNGTKAAAHVSWKYTYARDRVKTAHDFIEGVASQSILTGRSYVVRTSEGKTYPVKDILYNELRRLVQLKQTSVQVSTQDIRGNLTS